VQFGMDAKYLRVELGSVRPVIDNYAMWTVIDSASSGLSPTTSIGLSSTHLGEGFAQPTGPELASLRAQ
jgi:hypothetical protein